MAIKTIGYSSAVVTGQIVEAPHVSQSIEAFSAATQKDYDISISGSFKVTGSQFIEPDTLLTQIKPFILSYDETTGQIFKMNTASIEDGDGEQEVYRTGSGINNIIPNKFGTYDNTGTNSAIASGNLNKINSNCAFIGGGTLNTASGACSFVGGGSNNTTLGAYTFIGGGQLNTASSTNGLDVIVGGCRNSISSTYENNVIIGGAINKIDTDNTRHNYILVGNNNTISSCYNANDGIVAGSQNTISSQYSSGQNQISAGSCNTISGYAADYSSIQNGFQNLISAAKHTHIIGGQCNTSTKSCSFIVGSDIIASSVCTTFVNNLTVSGSAAGSSVVIMRGLPTSDPANLGQLWNDSGALKVSAG